MINERKAGVILSYLSMAVSVLTGIIYVPFLLRTIGQNEYGLYQLLGGFVSYAAIFDFGLSNTITRFYVRYKKLGEQEKLENMLSLSRIIFWILNIVCLIICIVIYFCLDKVYPKLDATQMESGRKIFLLLIISVCTTIPTYVYTAISNAEEKYIFLRGSSLLVAVLQPIIVILLVKQHPSAVSVVFIQTILNVVLSVTKILYVKLRLKTKFKLHHWDNLLLKEMLAFSFFVFLNTVIDQINWQLGKTIMGIAYGDTALVALLSIGLQLANYFMMFSSNVNSVFYAQINKSVLEDDSMAKTNEIFVKVGRVQAIILALVLSGFIIFGQEFVDIWAGVDNHNAYYIALALMASLFIPMTQNCGILILQAKNLHKWRSVAYAIVAAVNIIISAILVKPYGEYGVAAGTVLSFIIGNNIIINIIYKYKAKIDVNTLLKYLLKVVLIVGVLTTAVFFVNRLIIVNNYGMLFVKIIVYCILYCVLAWFLLMNKYEHNLIISLFKKIFGVLKRKKTAPEVVSDGQCEDKEYKDNAAKIVDASELGDNADKEDNEDEKKEQVDDGRN